MAQSPTEPQAAPRNPQPSWWRRILSLRGREGEDDGEVTFPPGFLESLERLRILALRASGGGLKEGHRLGAYRGGQLEFHDHRSYAPGDDLRYLDWNLYARLGKPFIKEFAREEAGAVHLLLDASPSMALGAPSKWTFARRLAALLAHVAWKSRDRVWAWVFRGADRPLATYPPQSARAETRSFVEWLGKEHIDSSPAKPRSEETAEPAEGVLLSAIQAFLRRSPVRGRVFVISDFWQEETEVSDAVRRLSAAGFDLAAIHVLASDEVGMFDHGELRVLAVEENGEVELNGTDDAAMRYEEELNAHLTRIEGLFQRRGGLYLYERSDTPLERVLIESLRRRRWLV